MNIKYAVAVMKGDEETILGIFNTRAEADEDGRRNVVPHTLGLQYCFASEFLGFEPVGNSIEVYSFYNV